MIEILTIIGAVLLFVVFWKIFKNVIKALLTVISIIAVVSLVFGFLVYQDYQDLKKMKDTVYFEENGTLLNETNEEYYIVVNVDEFNTTEIDMKDFLKYYKEGRIRTHPELMTFKLYTEVVE